MEREGLGPTPLLSNYYAGKKRRKIQDVGIAGNSCIFFLRVRVIEMTL
jgi:hypothetical protein